MPNRQILAIEVKRNLAPKLEKGFHAACDELKPDRRFAVYPGTECFPLPRDIDAAPAADLAEIVPQRDQASRVWRPRHTADPIVK